MTTPADERVTVGLVRGLHGLRGAVRVEVLSDDPERFAVGSVLFAEGDERPLTIAWSRPGQAGPAGAFRGAARRARRPSTLRERYLEAARRRAAARGHLLLAPDRRPGGHAPPAGRSWARWPMSSVPVKARSTSCAADALGEILVPGRHGRRRRARPASGPAGGRCGRAGPARRASTAPPAPGGHTPLHARRLEPPRAEARARERETQAPGQAERIAPDGRRGSTDDGCAAGAQRWSHGLGRDALMRIDVITLFPAIFPGPLAESIPGRALEQGLAELHAHDLRQWGLGKHRSVDDYPYGGGAGMILRPEPVAAALDAVAPAGLGCVSHPARSGRRALPPGAGPGPRRARAPRLRLSSLRGHRRSRAVDGRPRALGRRLRRLRRRDPGAGGHRRGAAAAAGRHRRRLDRGGIVLARPARVPAVDPTAGVPGPVRARDPRQRQPRRGRRLAPRAGPRADPAEAARPAVRRRARATAEAALDREPAILRHRPRQDSPRPRMPAAGRGRGPHTRK